MTNDASYQKRLGITFVALFLIFSACGKENEIPNKASPESWPETAASAVGALRDIGYDCLEEGRELYPVLYTCSLESDASGDGIFLYADDRNALAGVRVFYSEASTEMSKDALDMAFGTQTLIDLPVPGESTETSVTIGTFIVETGASEGILFLRITPLNEIQ